MLGAKGIPRRRGSDSGNVLPFSLSPSRERTLEIHCDICQAHFIAWYGTEEDADSDTIDVEKCGLCGGDPLKKDNFKHSVLRLWRGSVLLLLLVVKNLCRQTSKDQNPAALPAQSRRPRGEKESDGVSTVSMAGFSQLV